MVKKTKEQYVLDGNKVHESFYTYECVVYLGGKHKIEITCPIHGNFWQLAESHLQGAGCKKCARINSTEKQRKSQENFIEDFYCIHGNTYGTSKINYYNSKTKVDVICSLHGTFSATPHDLLSGVGCPECAIAANGLAKRKSTEDYVFDCQQKHGDTYGYSKVDYISLRHKVVVTCKTHGDFSQIAGNHLSGSGCPSCGRSGYNVNKPGTFYVLKAGDITKVGVTNVAVATRVKQLNYKSRLDFEIKQTNYNVDGKAVLALESEVLSFLRAKYKNPIKVFSGSTECFLDVNLQELLDFVSPLANPN